MNSSNLALSQLESHLWEAANILRGPVDAADFKTYVFPLVTIQPEAGIGAWPMKVKRNTSNRLCPCLCMVSR